MRGSGLGLVGGPKPWLCVGQPFLVTLVRDRERAAGGDRPGMAVVGLGAGHQLPPVRRRPPGRECEHDSTQGSQTHPPVLNGAQCPVALC